MSSTKQPASQSSLAPILSAVADCQLRWFQEWLKCAVFRKLDADRDGLQQLGREKAHKYDLLAKAGDLDGENPQPALIALFEARKQFDSLTHVIDLKIAEGVPFAEEDYDSSCLHNYQLIRQLRRFETAFQLAAGHLDTLTGLRSRHGMMAELEAEQNRFVRTDAPYCLAVCDIDHFKSINDTYGHDVGDDVLKAVSSVLVRMVRSFDEVYRMGGEEFLICLKTTEIDEAKLVLDRLRRQIAAMELPISDVDNRFLSVTASFGVVQTSREDTVDRLIIKADKALYNAKETGRNRVIIG